MKDLVEAMVKALVDNPDEVQVRMIEGEETTGRKLRKRIALEILE